MDLKKAKLDDDAAIYNRGPQKTEKETWAEMTRKQRLEQFRTYYLKYVIIGAVILGFAIYFIYSIVKPKPAVLVNIAVNNFTYVDYDRIRDDYFRDNGLSAKDCTLTFDTAYSLESDYSSIQRFSVYVYSGDMDVLISSSPVFERYAASGIMKPVNEYLDAELFQKLDSAGLIFYTSEITTEYDGTVTSVGERLPYGIDLSGLTIFKDFSYEGNIPFAGIIANSAKSDNSAELLTYMIKTYTE